MPTVKCHYAKCHYAECHHAEWHYAECHNANNSSSHWLHLTWFLGRYNNKDYHSYLLPQHQKTKRQAQQLAFS